MDPVGVGVVTEVAVEADHPWVDEGVDRPWAEVAHQWEAVVAASGQVVEAPDVADPCEVDLAETEVTEERDHTEVACGVRLTLYWPHLLLYCVC